MPLTPYPSVATLPEVVANGGKVPNIYLNPSWISLKYDLGIPDDATITGIGSPNFSDAGYGTLTLTTGPYAGQTVTQAIQHALDLCAVGPVGLLWDVRCSVGVQAVPGLGGDQLLSALTFRRPGNLHIVGRPGAGVILRAQTNASIFCNELATFGTLVSAGGTDQQINAIGNIQFGNVLIEGLYANANSGINTGTIASCPNQLNPTFVEIYLLNIFRFFGVQDITLRDCTLVGAGGFHVWLGNWQRFRAIGCTVDSLTAGGTEGGNDCFHINSPGNDFLARDCRVSCEDDHFGINNADGTNSSGSFHGPSTPAWGDITNVRAYNTTIYPGHTGSLGNLVRVMCAAGVKSDGHVFDGVTGSAYAMGWLVNSSTPGATPGNIGRVDFRNIDVDASSVLFRIGEVGGPVMDSTGVRRLNIQNVKRSGSHLTAPFMICHDPVQRLDVDGLHVFDDGSSGSSKPQVHVVSGGLIQRFQARNVGLYGSSGQQDMPLLKVESGGSVPFAHLDGVNSDHVLNLVSNAGTLGEVVASGVSMTNSGSGGIIGSSASYGPLILSNSDPSTADSTGTAPTSKAGDYYGAAGSPTISLSPSSLGTSLAGQSVAVTGTDFTTASTFALSGLAGSSITATVIHSRTSATLTITTGSTTGTATITCSDFATANLSVSTGVTTYLHDTFTGTPGTSLTGHAPNTVVNGSDVWADRTGSPANAGFLEYASGGGCKVQSFGTAGQAEAMYALTGVSLDQTITLKWTTSDTAALVGFLLHFPTDASTYVQVFAAHASGGSIALNANPGGTLGSPYVFTLNLGSQNTMIAATRGTSMTVTVNGTIVASGLTIPAGTSPQLFFGQFAGTVGSVIFNEILVTSN